MKWKIAVGGLLIMGGGLLAILLASNALRSTAEARFGKKVRGLASLRITGPWGLHYIEYDVVPGSNGKPTLGGHSGPGEFPLFGDVGGSANYYPESGATLGIEPERHVRLCGAFGRAAALENPRPGTEERYGLFLLVTRDPTWSERLERDAPAFRTP